MSDTSFADKAREVADWLEESWFPDFFASRTDDSEAAGELWLAWQACQAVRKFEQPDYLLNPAAEDVFLLLVQIREMEAQAFAEPEAHRARNTLAELITAVLQHEFTPELADRELAVLVEYKSNPPRWVYEAGEIVEPGDQRLSEYESWQLSGSERHVIKLIKSTLLHTTVIDAYDTAIVQLQRHYAGVETNPESE